MGKQPAKCAIRFYLEAEGVKKIKEDEKKNTGLVLDWKDGVMKGLRIAYLGLWDLYEFVVRC